MGIRNHWGTTRRRTGKKKRDIGKKKKGFAQSHLEKALVPRGSQSLSQKLKDEGINKKRDNFSREKRVELQEGKSNY